MNQRLIKAPTAAYERARGRLAEIASAVVERA